MKIHTMGTLMRYGCNNCGYIFEFCPDIFEIKFECFYFSKNNLSYVIRISYENFDTNDNVMVCIDDSKNTYNEYYYPLNKDIEALSDLNYYLKFVFLQ